MSLYTVVVERRSQWNTTTLWRGAGLTALEVLDTITFRRDATQRVLLITSHGSHLPVTTSRIIRAARQQADEIDNLASWNTLMITAVLDAVLDTPDSPFPVTDDLWEQAGRWWAEHVGDIPGEEIWRPLHSTLEGDIPEPGPGHGVSRFVQAVRDQQRAGGPHESRPGIVRGATPKSVTR
jgi:hypothetical protein